MPGIAARSALLITVPAYPQNSTKTAIRTKAEEDSNNGQRDS
jgi:hypothetical protein